MLADNISHALATTLGTRVDVGRVDFRPFNRMIIDNLSLYDQQQKTLLRAGRVSVTIELLPLLQQRIVISSAQLFGMRADLYKKDSTTPLNCQFVIDSLKSKDTASTAPLDLKIASLIIRNGSIAYNRLDKPLTKGKFSPHHINISQLSSHIILYKLTDDSLNVSINRLSLYETSGIKLNNLTADIKATKNSLSIQEMVLAMPKTKVEVPELHITYATQGKQIRNGSLKFSGHIKAEKVSPADLAPMCVNSDIATLPAIKFTAKAEGTDRSADATLSVYSADDEGISLQAAVTATDLLGEPKADMLINRLSITENVATTIANVFILPDITKRTGGIAAKGRVKILGKHHFAVHSDIKTTRAGTVEINGKYDSGSIKTKVATTSLDIAQLTEDTRFGNIICDIDIEAKIDASQNIVAAKAKGNINEMSFNDYVYHNANINLSYANDIAEGTVDIKDPNLTLTASGKTGFGRRKSLQGVVKLGNFCPAALHLTKQFGNDRFAFDMNADISGSDFNDIDGFLSINDISITNPDSGEKDAFVNNITMSIENNGHGQKTMTLNSDFAQAYITGRFTTSELTHSFTNLFATHLPAFVVLPKKKPNNNDLRFKATIDDISFLKRLFSIPLEINSPLSANGFVNSTDNNANITISAPAMKIAGIETRNSRLQLWTEDDAVCGTLGTTIKDAQGQTGVLLDIKGHDNNIYTSVSWDNMRPNIFKGRVNTITTFSPTLNGKTLVNISIPNSSFEVGDSIWHISSRGIQYDAGKLSLDHLVIGNENQHLYINGIASTSMNDSICAELKNIDVSYILNLVNFHSVRFDGLATGNVSATAVMDRIKADATLNIKDFRFENGRLGTMKLKADYNHEEGRINLEGVTADTASYLAIKGFVSPKHNDIDLNMTLEDTRLEFMNSFCGSFLEDINLTGNGHLRLHGPLNTIDLEGCITAAGGMTLQATNCRYTIDKDSIKFVPSDIIMDGVRLSDTMGNTAMLTGGVHHRHLERISYDITVNTDRLLAYDVATMKQEETYCGYAIINGKIGVHGKGNEVNITAECTPLEDSFFTYNAASPETIKSQDFITWGSVSARNDSIMAEEQKNSATDHHEPINTGNSRTNVRLNFMVNMTPKARLHLIMDEDTGDNINLFGSGTLQIRYYNKGTFDIFGNYVIDHGAYKMTIQNLMRRDFVFQKGGTIAFAGDPYNAALNLQAAYMLNSVSLADLSIGSSFKSNNVPVNCLMNISGTPEQPKVEFGLNLPSLSADARQMVYSLMNSAEEMNQQVLYLLAIGRFYSQTNNAEDTQRTKQSTLAMQSFLSGTLSQQLNNVLGHVTGNSNWSVGANITPGADGFNNGVYEGLLSGRMFNNRLLFNGQFGYRDNINTNTQNFIGDFTLQYLLTPNGNISLKMYNQSNDRYFTRSSLNTQGIGIVIQKEFGK